MSPQFTPLLPAAGALNPMSLVAVQRRAEHGWQRLANWL